MDKFFIFTYRYMWQIKGNKSINFKIVTDTDDGLKSFEEALKKVDNVEKISREYLCEIDITKMGLFESIYESKTVENNNKEGEKI